MAADGKAAGSKRKEKHQKRSGGDGEGSELDGAQKEHHVHNPEAAQLLYEQGEMLLRKQFHAREKQKALEKEEEARECTFAPNINKGPITSLQKPPTPEWKRRKKRLKKESIEKKEAKTKETEGYAKRQAKQKAYAVVEFDGSSNGSKRRIREVFADEGEEELEDKTKRKKDKKKEKKKKKKKKKRKPALPKGLTFEVGDLITVLKKGVGNGGSWCQGEFQGQRGVFPASCVDLAGEHRLYFQGLDALKRRDEAAEKHAKEIDTECTFSPTLRAETPEQVRWRRQQQLRQKRRRAERMRRKKMERENQKRDRRALDAYTGRVEDGSHQIEDGLRELDEKELLSWVSRVKGEGAEDRQLAELKEALGPALDEDLDDDMLDLDEDELDDFYVPAVAKREGEKRKVFRQMDEVGGVEELGYNEERAGEDQKENRRRRNVKEGKRKAQGLGGAINIEFAKFKEALNGRETLRLEGARARARRRRVVKSTFGKASRFGAPSKTKRQEDEEKARRLEPRPPADDLREARVHRVRNRRQKEQRQLHVANGRLNVKAGPLARMNAVLQSESSWLEQQQLKRRALAEKRDGMQLLRLEHRLVELEMEKLNDRIDNRIHKVEHDLQDLSVAVEKKVVDLNYIAAGAGQRAAARSFLDASTSTGSRRGHRPGKKRRLRPQDPNNERYRSMAGLAHVGRGSSGFGPGLGYAAAMGHAASVAARSGHILQPVPPPRWLPSVSRAEAEAAASSARMLAATGRLGQDISATEGVANDIDLDVRLAPFSRPTSLDLSDSGLSARGKDLGLIGTGEFLIEWNR